MVVQGTHPFSDKKSSLDQFSYCFLFGIRYCTINNIPGTALYNTGILHSPVQSISYYARPPLFTPVYIITNTYVPARSSVFYHTEYTAKYFVLRAVRNTPCPNAVVCSVWCCWVLCAGFGCGGLGLWADDSALFPKKKKKNASAKIHGERVECPRKP